MRGLWPVEREREKQKTNNLWNEGKYHRPRWSLSVSDVNEWHQRRRYRFPFTWSINWLLFCVRWIERCDSINTVAYFIYWAEYSKVRVCDMRLFFPRAVVFQRWFDVSFPSILLGMCIHFVRTSFRLKWIYTVNALENLQLHFMSRLGAKFMMPSIHWFIHNIDLWNTTSFLSLCLTLSPSFSLDQLFRRGRGETAEKKK